jgi:hypothetical protein
MRALSFSMQAPSSSPRNVHRKNHIKIPTEPPHRVVWCTGNVTEQTPSRRTKMRENAKPKNRTIPVIEQVLLH